VVCQLESFHVGPKLTTWTWRKRRCDDESAEFPKLPALPRFPEGDAEEGSILIGKLVLEKNGSCQQRLSRRLGEKGMAQQSGATRLV